MDSSIYVFGEMVSGYTQYPDDYSKDIFQTLYSKAKAKTQIAIHRNGNLMYYAYIRKLDNKKYIGICIVINGQYITDYMKLFSLFEDKIALLASEGKLIHYTESGDITSNIDQLYKVDLDIDNFTKRVRNDFHSIENKSFILPPKNFANSKDSIIAFDVDDSPKEIISATYNYAFTYIYKAHDYNTEQINSYEAVLNRIHIENNKLKEENMTLTVKNKKIMRQKKQMKVVISLILILLIATFYFYNTLDEKNRNIAIQENTIQRQKTDNNELNQKNTKLNNIHNKLVDKHDILLSNYEQLEINYNLLSSQYQTLDSLHTANLKEISKYKKEINSLSYEYESHKRSTKNILRKKDDYIYTLENRCNSYLRESEFFKNKYFSTKEGKKELKKNSQLK